MSQSGGFGAIGKLVAQRLDEGIDGLALTVVAARDVMRAEAALAPAALLRDVAEPALGHGRSVMALSCGALLENLDLVDLARRSGGRILVPTGDSMQVENVPSAENPRTGA